MLRPLSTLCAVLLAALVTAGCSDASVSLNCGGASRRGGCILRLPRIRVVLRGGGEAGESDDDEFRQELPAARQSFDMGKEYMAKYEFERAISCFDAVCVNPPKLA